MDDLALLRSLAENWPIPAEAEAFGRGQLRAVIQAEVAAPPRLAGLRKALRSPLDLRLLPRLQVGLAALVAVVVAAVE